MPDTLRRPVLVGWGITDRCNLSCPHCYSAAGKCDRGELSTAECLQLIERLAAMGTERIGWTGGEPLLRKDLERLIAHALDRGIQSGITTNGILLSPRRVESLQRAGVRAIQISLDGSTAERNRRVRGASEREFGLVIEGIRSVRMSGIDLHLAMLLGAETLDDVRPFLSLALEHGVRSVRFCGFVPWGSGTDESVRSRLELSERLCEVRALVEELQRVDTPTVLFDPAFGPLPPDYSYHECQAGMQMLYISGTGDVYPCTSLIQDQFRVGNVRFEPVEELWASPLMSLVAVYPRDRITGPCADCEHFASCRGACRGIALAATGDFNASFPNCLACVAAVRQPS